MDFSVVCNSGFKAFLRKENKMPFQFPCKVIQNGEQNEIVVPTGAGKVIGIYFSAHWCPPCRAFTPVLCEYYKKHKAAGKELEIVFVSSDKDEESFFVYFKGMPWLAVPFSKIDDLNALKTKYNVSGVPKLVFIDGETGDTINEDGRKIVNQGKYPTE